VSTRPFRTRPPSTGNSLLRREVQRELLARFEARVTVLQAGAGFGKSTSLAQAFEQNLLSPVGTDYWLACEPSDSEADYLTAGLRVAVGLTPEGPVREIAHLLASSAPTETCLIIDDSHEIPLGSSGAKVLDELIASLPANGHVLLATRHSPPASLARLDAQHGVRWIDDKTLALSPVEVAMLADREGVDVGRVADLGGWPALVSLALRSRDARDFVTEEVTAWLTHDQRRALTVVVAIGGADRRLVEALIGVKADKVLAGLPLVHEIDGWFEAHDLWHGPLRGALTQDQRTDFQRQAVQLLLAWSEPARAVNLCLASEQPEALADALEAAILTVDAPDPSVLRRWLSAIPDPTRQLPVGRFLSGLVTRADAPASVQCLELFEQAAAGFRAVGHTAGEVESLAQTGFVYHVRRDRAALAKIGARLVELTLGGEPAATPYAQIAGAFVALSSGDPLAMNEALSRIEPGSLTSQFEAIADWLRAQAQNMSGYRSVDAAERCVASRLPIPGLADVQLGSRWHIGDFEFLNDESRWAPIPEGDRDHLLRHVWRAAIAIAMGRGSSGEEALSSARAVVPTGSATTTTNTMFGLIELCLAMQKDSTIDVGQGLDELFANSPLDRSNRHVYSSVRGPIARYRPEYWEHWFDVELGPMVRRDRDIGRALAAVDSDGDLSLIGDLLWPEHPGELIPAAMLGGACLLVAGGWALGRPEARGAATWLAHTVGKPSFDHFRNLTEHDVAAVAKAAAEILSQVGVPPQQPLCVRLLGPPELHHGAGVSDHGDWRRDNVRALLAYLITNSPSTRDKAMAALWPDADEAAARRSIRSTLNLLIGVLEPSRGAGDANYFVRSEGAVLRLDENEHIEVDVWTFETHLESAEELLSDGVPQLAIEPLRSAVELYRGDFAADLYHDWLTADRDRLRMRFVSAASTLAALLAAEGSTGEALTVADSALALDPWSEAAHRAAIRAHLFDEDRGAATKAARRCRSDLESIGGAGDEETIELITDLLR